MGLGRCAAGGAAEAEGGPGEARVEGEGAFARGVAICAGDFVVEVEVGV